MKNKYHLGLYEKSMPDTLSWDDKFKEAYEAGYDFIEISIDETDFRLQRIFDKKLEEEIMESMSKSTVKIRSMCLSGHRKYPLGSLDDTIRNKGLDIFYKAIDFASRLGIRVIQLAGYDVYYEEGNQETEARFVEYLHKGIEYASKNGVLCGFETMETPFMNTVEKAMHYVDIIGSPYLHIYPDLGNLTNAAKADKKDLYDDISMGKNHIVATHLKETEPGVFRNMEFGTGHVDFVKGIQALWNQGVRMYACEFWYSEKTDYQERLRHNNTFIRNKFEEALEEVENEI